MTGGSRKPDPLPQLDPSPRPIPGREISEAKKKVRKRAGKGRQQNILAGQMMAQRNNILNTKLSP